MASTTCKFVLLVLCSTAVSVDYEYDANDFAVQVVDYNEGNIPEDDVDWIDGTPFNNPANALGRPTIDTTGDNDNIPVWEIVPVVGVYPAFRSSELVTVGNGGRLILKFNHHVADDKNNPYGIDFIVFGNSQQNAGSETGWENGDPNEFYIWLSSVIEEPALVLVSQSGDVYEPNQWYPFSNGPHADTWAPTFGRVYDTTDPNITIGNWNLWWGNPTNPTLPVDPNLSPQEFVGQRLAYMSQTYGKSAGGTGFDLKWLHPNDYECLVPDPCSGEKWIQYIWIEGNNDYAPEIDSVSDVACCGDYKHPFPAGDTDDNCIVNEEDLALLVEYWLEDGIEPESPAQAGDLYPNGRVDFQDFAVLAADWKLCTWDCDE